MSSGESKESETRTRILAAAWRLMEERQGQGVRISDVAADAGVSRQAVNALETDKHSPSLDLAYRISAVFHVPVEQIFENEHARSA